MKRTLYTLAITALLSTAGAAQSAPPTQTPPQPPAPQQTATPTQEQEMTVVGCLVKGIKPNVYLIERAVDPKKKDDPPKAFRLQALLEDPDFESQVNAKVELMGTAEIKRVPPPAAGAKIDENILPVFKVKSFQRVTDTCTM